MTNRPTGSTRLREVTCLRPYQPLCFRPPSPFLFLPSSFLFMPVYISQRDIPFCFLFISLFLLLSFSTLLVTKKRKVFRTRRDACVLRVSNNLSFVGKNNTEEESFRGIFVKGFFFLNVSKHRILSNDNIEREKKLHCGQSYVATSNVGRAILELLIFSYELSVRIWLNLLFYSFGYIYR